MKLLTPQKYINLAVNFSPSRYASTNYELSKLKVYDTLFNVIGNGIRDEEELIDELQDRNKDILDPPLKYFSNKTLYYGYLKTKTVGPITFGDSDSRVKEMLTKEEQKLHPEIIYWLEHESISEFVPYPNFKKEYSIVWCPNALNILTQDWINEAIYFYDKCEEFFKDSNSHKYHYAVPQDENKLKSLIQDYETDFKRYKKDNLTQKEFYNEITKRYELEYNGDTLDFIKRRWNIEKIRILEFIKETQNMLKMVKI